MKANELRIGNYVDIKYDEYECESFQFNFESGWNMEFVHPIPLTEEWLLKLGFIKDDNEFRSPKIIGFKNSVYEICVRLHDDFFDMLLEEEELNVDTFTVILPLKLKYVHQLQNIYFALIGKELTK